MQFKKIVLALAQLGLISNIGVAAAKENDQFSNINKTDCKQETFWTAWFDNTNQFKGFGNSPSKKEISKAQYLFAENYQGIQSINTISNNLTYAQYFLKLIYFELLVVYFLIIFVL